MTIFIKTPDEIEKMRVAGRLTSEVLDMITDYVKVGVTTDELDRICHNYIVNVQQAIPAPLNYKGFPKSICTSVNYQVCHGIPSNKKLKDGDIINIDVTVIKDGYHGDSSRMFMVGKPNVRAKRIIDISYECLWIGIKQVKAGISLKEIGRAIENHAKSKKCSIVHEYCGHGIGRAFHEKPQVLHYYSAKEDDVILQPGMTFTIEPMINLGKRHVKLLPDKWTVVTKDHKLSAQWEHTILVTEKGAEVMTLAPYEKQ
ncbi:type I methionyl aminopeptidase [Candidatus Marithrix sp. Canyon 246]|uniref:type I methionyl aminopeptidase n=1 Tax=Candidatus Marithrix sp. Canyon 246 TaxID=1827136 RepID=UPI00084A0BDB|nr:type I methionyl aminopeptidase [Candidatus Marithrix sp. Canyon 246]